MDWARAIERNSDALKAIVATLFAMLGLAGDAALARVMRIPRGLQTSVLRVLRPAESAMRRLIVIAARGLAVKLPPARPMPKGRVIAKGGNSRSSFQLFDPRKRFAHQCRRTGPRSIPRVHFIWGDPRLSPPWSTSRPTAAPAPPPDDGHVDAGRLRLRLQALKTALEDLPRQARRLARWRARRENARRPTFTSPLRPGRPPGYRGKPLHEVDEVLIECHGLAFDALQPDTS